jgi:hypothetical protein
VTQPLDEYCGDHRYGHGPAWLSGRPLPALRNDVRPNGVVRCDAMRIAEAARHGIAPMRLAASLCTFIRTRLCTLTCTPTPCSNCRVRAAHARPIKDPCHGAGRGSGALTDHRRGRVSYVSAQARGQIRATAVGKIDEIHDISLTTRHGAETSDTLKYFSNASPPPSSTPASTSNGKACCPAPAGSRSRGGSA